MIDQVDINPYFPSQCLLAVLEGKEQDQRHLDQLHDNEAFEDDEGIAESGMWADSTPGHQILRVYVLQPSLCQLVILSYIANQNTPVEYMHK